ncbi:MAG: anti-sigma factor [Planctomycetia bacterium]|nr:anti-sigma factor [Planctomycetia bacterium]
MTRDDLVERFALHLLGALEGEEARAMAARAAAPSADDAEALRAATELVATLGRATAPVAPPPGARAALLRRARASRPSGDAADAASSGPALDTRRAPGAADPSGRPSKWGLVGLAALFLLLAGLQVFNVLTRNATTRGRDDLLGPLTDPDVERWVLGSTDPANPRRVAVAFHDTATRRILVRGAHLPALETGQVYVLWALDRGDDGKTPRNLTAFTGGQPVIDAVVPDAVAPSSLKALAISIERDPRIAAPTRVVAAGGAP